MNHSASVSILLKLIKFIISLFCRSITVPCFSLFPSIVAITTAAPRNHIHHLKINRRPRSSCKFRTHPSRNISTHPQKNSREHSSFPLAPSPNRPNSNSSAENDHFTLLFAFPYSLLLLLFLLLHKT